MTLVLAGIQAANIGAGAKLFWVIVATVVALVLTKPVRSIKTVLPGVDPNRSYLKETVSKVASYYGPALAANSIEEAGKQQKPEMPAEPELPPISVSSLSPLPEPEWVTTPRPTAAASSPSSPWEFWEGRAAKPAPQAVAAPVGSEVQPSQARPTLPVAAPLAIEAAAVASERQSQPPATRADVAPPAAPAAGTPDNPLTATGYVLPADDRGLYRTDVDTAPGEYVPAGELELSEDGTEHDRVTYHATSDQQG